jgi:transposase
MTEASALRHAGEEGGMDWIACVGLDWADQKHAYEIRSREGSRSTGSVSAAPEHLHGWMAEVRAQFPNGRILLVVEDGRSSLLDALVGYPFLAIIRVNPLASSKYRESRHLSGSSNDPLDASLLCDYALKHLDELRVWKPNDAETRRVRSLSETRRKLVDQRTAFTHELTATLKGYFPQVVEWLKDVKPAVLWQFVRLWPTLEALRAADDENIDRIMKAHRLHFIQRRVQTLRSALDTAVRLTNDTTSIEVGALRAGCLAHILEVVDEQIRVVEKALAAAWEIHQDRELFDSLPGAGAVFAPRLAAAFSTDRDRFNSAQEVQCFSGIAPVTKASGRRVLVQARYQFPTFVHQTFHEYAECSLPHSSWARESYRLQRDGGAGHHAAIRKVAFQWIRIVFKLWKDRHTYDEAVHLAALRHRKSPIAARLAT